VAYGAGEPSSIFTVFILFLRHVCNGFEGHNAFFDSVLFAFLSLFFYVRERTRTIPITSTYVQKYGKVLIACCQTDNTTIRVYHNINEAVFPAEVKAETCKRIKKIFVGCSRCHTFLFKLYS
jgi:hypothetical protein